MGSAVYTLVQGDDSWPLAAPGSAGALCHDTCIQSECDVRLSLLNDTFVSSVRLHDVYKTSERFRTCVQRPLRLAFITDVGSKDSSFV